MNLITQPQKITPAYNPVIYQLGSTFSNILYFEVQVRDLEQNAVVLNEKAYVTPVAPTSSVYNLSDISRDLVKWEIKPTQNIVEGITKGVREVRLDIREAGLVGSNINYLTTTQSTPNLKLWNARLDRVSFSSYDYDNFYFEGTQSINFLTKKPNYYKVNDASREYLYYLNNASYSLSWQIENITKSGVVISSTTSNITSTQSMVRLDISPKLLKTNLGNFLTSSYYQVYLKQGATAVSEKKIYEYEAGTPCEIDVVNILWENYLGGIDSYQFINPMEMREVVRTNFKKDPYQFDSFKKYTDIQDEVYNQNERTIDSALDSMYRMMTKPLTDAENNWLSHLLESRNIFIELNSGRIYPVQLVETTYNIERNKYNRTIPIQTEWTFKIVSDYLVNDDLTAGITQSTTTTTTTTSTTTTTTTSPPTTTTTTTTSSSTTTTTLPPGTAYDFDDTARPTGCAACNAFVPYIILYAAATSENSVSRFYTDVNLTNPYSPPTAGSYYSWRRNSGTQSPHYGTVNASGFTGEVTTCTGC